MLMLGSLSVFLFMCCEVFVLSMMQGGLHRSSCLVRGILSLVYILATLRVDSFDML